MAVKQGSNSVVGQKYESLPMEPPPSYNEVVNNQSPAASALNITGTLNSGDDGVMPKPSAPILEPDSYDGGFTNIGQQYITNAPYSTATSTIPVNNVITDERICRTDERIPCIGPERYIKEDDNRCCACNDGCEGCLACMTACNCVLQCCTLILQILSVCAKD